MRIMSFTKELKSSYYEIALSLRHQGFSYREISKKTGVSKTQVHRWLYNFAISNTQGPMKHKNEARNCAKTAPDCLTASASPVSETPEEKIARLERELMHAQLRADFYNEMIDVAERKFNISIRKKAGAKR